MLQNYIKIAFRSLFKNKLYSFINIFGLALGIACCLLIILFVRDEWRYDDFHSNADRIYRLAVEENYGEGQNFFNTVTPLVLSQTLKDNFPEIEAVARVGVINSLVKRDEASFTERIHLVDLDFYNIFDFSLESGSVSEDPRTVLLTPEIAQKYFGDESPLGKPLSLRLANDFETFTVSGIIRPAPSYSSVQFNMILPFANSRTIWSERAHRSYFNVFVETYLLMPENYRIADLSAKTPAMIRQVMGERYQEGSYLLHFQPLTDIHLNTDFPAGLQAISDPVYAYLLSIIALLVFLIACINFVTLSLGRSTERALEVGVRKVVGAGRSQLIRQFLGETILLSFLSLLIGLLLAELFLPTFNQLSGKDLALGFDSGFIAILIGLMLLIGAVAGSYPAIFLSRFQPIAVLKGRLRLGGASRFRQSLSILQFALSVFLMICTFGIANQLQFLQEKNLGFDQEQVMIIPTGLPPQEGMPLVERFRNELRGHDAIRGLAASAFSFGQGWMQIGYDADDGKYRTFIANRVEPEFLKTMNMEMVAGRFFQREIPSDMREAIVINEAMAAEYGWDNPIGKSLPGSFDQHQIIGVVKNFHFQSLHSPVSPLALVMDAAPILAGASDVGISASPNPKISVRIKAGDTAATLSLLKNTWQKVAPNLDYSFTFLDETLNLQYRQEERLGTIVNYATVFAVLIACLGLFGLATLTAIRRTKEIGVRKVLGASVSNIAVMITKDFIKLVVIAVLLAIPAAYFAMDAWLENFAFRTEVGIFIFLSAGLLALIIAAVTVGFQAIRAAFTDPVKSLRYE